MITILRCFLSFSRVVTSRNSIVFRIKFSRKKNDHLSPASSLLSRAISWPRSELRPAPAEVSAKSKTGWGKGVSEVRSKQG
jgi:hypothetical protein